MKNFIKLRNKILTTPSVERIYHNIVGHLADVFIISFPKSGRTWVRMLLAQAISLEYGLKLNLDLYKMTWGSNIPNIKTDPRTGNYSKFGGAKQFSIQPNMKNKKVILLVRDPRDVLVSYFYEWTKRRDIKYDHGISSFVKEDFTLPRLISFMNCWGNEMEKNKNLFVKITYENLHQDTANELKKILNFLNINISEKNISKAVENSSFNNMQNMEKGNKFAGDHRMQATNISDPNSFKLRKGKVGGYKEILNKEDINYINQVINEKLNPIFNYHLFHINHKSNP